MQSLNQVVDKLPIIHYSLFIEKAGGNEESGGSAQV